MKEKTQEKTQEKICFVISPIGKEDSDTRKISDQILKHIIKPAVNKYDYLPIRADEIDEPGIITSQIIQKIVDSDLVIADLSGHNPNVFYELAIRHVIKKPLIQIIKKDETIPFDVAATRIIHFDIKDLDSVENTKNEILKQIESIQNGKADFDNPISISLDLKFLKESGNPEERSYADLVEAISDLRSGLINLERNMNDPERILPINYLERIIYKINTSSINLRKPPLFDEVIFLLREVMERIDSLRSLITKPNLSKELTMISNRIERIYSILRKIEDE